jgi:hypothetical protein
MGASDPGAVFDHLRRRAVHGARLSPLPAAVAQGLLELARRPGGRPYAVAILDDVRYRGLLDDDGLRAAAVRLRNRNGAVLARRWW